MRRSVVGVLALALLVGCQASRLRETVDIGVGTLSELPPDKMALVQVSQDAATTTVLTHERDTGWPDEHISWQDGRCVLLAWLEPRPMSFAPDPGPPSAVYLVRLIADGGSQVTWVMVDATSGELGASIGDAVKTTCGKT